MTTTLSVPGKFDVAINGVGYMLMDEPDTSFGSRPALEHQSVRAQKDQSVTSGNIGESTINGEGFWRRSVDGWDHGSGQSYYDRSESDPQRFFQSQGVDVFGTKHQLSLLNDTAIAYTFAVAGGEILLAGFRVYINDVNAIKFVTAPLTTPWTTTTVTGTVAADTPRGLATDGSTVYIACGAAGIYTTDTSSSVAASFITGTVNHVFYVKGRLLATSANRLFNPVTAGALPSSLLDLGADWVWVDAAGGPQYIYLLATNGSLSVIYKTTIKPDGTALDIPTIAGELADAQEHGIALYAYGGKVFCATQTDVQMASIDGDGNLTFGSKIPITDPSFGSYGAFVGDDRFVWYPNPNRTSGDGLARMDLTVATLPNTPAYANDIQETTQTGQIRDINSIITYSGKRIFVCANVTPGGTDAYVETDLPVDSGFIDSGFIALDLADAKAPVAFDVEAATPGTTSITEALSYDRGETYHTVGTRSTAGGDAEFPIAGQAAVRQFGIRTTLTSDGTNSPILYRHTLKVEPSINQDAFIQLKLRLYQHVTDNTGGAVTQNPDTLRVGLEALQKSRAAVTLQQGSTEYTVVVRDLDWEAHSRCTPDSGGTFNGMATLNCKVLA